MFSSDSQLQEYKVATEWAYNQLQRAADTQKKNPDNWSFVNERYNTIKKLYEEAVNEFIIDKMKLKKEVENHDRIWAEIDAKNPNALIKDGNVY